MTSFGTMPEGLVQAAAMNRNEAADMAAPTPTITHDPNRFGSGLPALPARSAPAQPPSPKGSIRDIALHAKAEMDAMKNGAGPVEVGLGNKTGTSIYDAVAGASDALRGVPQDVQRLLEALDIGTPAQAPAASMPKATVVMAEAMVSAYRREISKNAQLSAADIDTAVDQFIKTIAASAREKK
jgi:hypothetical protein